MSVSTMVRKTVPVVSLKTNSLLALRKAILEERYEECAQHISNAIRFRATLLEIGRVLGKPGLHPENYA